jgi:hypothetical protein
MKHAFQGTGTSVISGHIGERMLLQERNQDTRMCFTRNHLGPRTPRRGQTQDSLTSLQRVFHLGVTDTATLTVCTSFSHYASLLATERAVSFQKDTLHSHSKRVNNPAQSIHSYCDSLEAA